MKKTVVLCDRCGKEIEGEFLEITAYKGRDFDICEKCADEFLMPVTHREPASEEKKPEKKKEDQKPSLPFDSGKAQALRDAGWSVRKVAAEMKVCEQTVYSHTHPAAPRPKKPLEGF